MLKLGMGLLVLVVIADASDSGGDTELERLRQRNAAQKNAEDRGPLHVTVEKNCRNRCRPPLKPSGNYFLFNLVISAIAPAGARIFPS